MPKINHGQQTRMKLKLWKYKELDHSLSEGRHSPSLLQEVVESEPFPSLQWAQHLLSQVLFCAQGEVYMRGYTSVHVLVNVCLKVRRHPTVSF